MILILLVGACLVSVVLTGGRLRRLAEIRIRWAALVAVALPLQVVIISALPSGAPALHRLLHVATYVMMGLFLWRNRRLPGMSLIGIGTLGNAAAIVANSGVMPASVAAEHLAGLRPGTGFQNSAHVAHAHLAWLGDIVPVPGLGPLSNVLSLGDLLIYAGLLVLLHVTCRNPAPDPPRGLRLARSR